MKRQIAQRMVDVIVPARIAMYLYDMHGGAGRVDGSMGFSIDFPRLVFRAAANAELCLHETHILDDDLYSSIQDALIKVQSHYSLRGATIEFAETIPAHRGFGSKTATLLSVVSAFCQVNGVVCDYRDLARLLGRGGTSGLGVNLIDRGGFLVDGGHSTREKLSFRPSSASENLSPPPILAHHVMPRWPILLVVPSLKRICGTQEEEFFQRVCPVPEEDVARLARITLSQVLPAIAEGDLRSFCEGINQIQSSVWKKSEIDLYGDEVRELMRRIRALGAWSTGMSSIGPCIYAVGGNLKRIRNTLQKERMSVFLTMPNNSGVRVK